MMENAPKSASITSESSKHRRCNTSKAPAASADQIQTRRMKKKLPASPKELRPPFDLIKENGEFFEGWPKPKLALLITGKIEGYLEPCGCAGMERMKGGMGRRYMLFKQLREQGWPVVGMDVGGLAHGFGRQAEIKFHTLVEGMRAMNYEAITLGETDLKLPAGELVAETAATPKPEKPLHFGQRGPVRLRLGHDRQNADHRSRRQEDRHHRRARQIVPEGNSKRRDRIRRSRRGHSKSPARIAKERRISGAPRPRHDGGIDRPGEKISAVQRGGDLGRTARAAGRAEKDRRLEDDLRGSRPRKACAPIVLGFFDDKATSGPLSARRARFAAVVHR